MINLVICNGMYVCCIHDEWKYNKMDGERLGTLQKVSESGMTVTIYVTSHDI